MPKDTFLQRKHDILSKSDKSHIGKWDKKILKLCEKINKKDNYYTTSSCSGRIVVMLDNEKKGGGLFILVYHDLVGFKRLRNDLDKVSKAEMVKFKQEPCILHIACRTLEDAQNILDKAKLAGWKKSGIIAKDWNFY
jgi:tRNA wybutosine-synthesizing protein 3